MYDLSWYINNAAFLALVLETVKRTGGHWLRASFPQFAPYYPVAIKTLGIAAALAMCFTAKANGLETLEIYGFHPYVGYGAGAALVFGGNTLIDAAWDKRKLIAEVLEAFKPKALVSG